MIPRLPMAPPALANASVMHGARIRRRRLPSHDLIEVMHASAELIHERIAADALVATFCALEGATVQATLVFTHSLMSLSAEISGGLLPGKQNGGVLPFRSLTDPPGMHSVVAHVLVFVSFSRRQGCGNVGPLIESVERDGGADETWSGPS